MIIRLQGDVSEEQTQHLLRVLKGEGISFTEVPGGDGAVVMASPKPGLDEAVLEKIPGVAEVLPDKIPYRIAARRNHPADTVVQVGTVSVGTERLVVMAGPCAVESRDQAMAVAHEVRRYGATLFRGGAFKPRTSPYSFQGLGEEGLKILAAVREATGMPVVSEIVSTDLVDLMVEYVDVLQVGARNMQNFELLKCVGRARKPVLLKRGLSATIEEWIMSAEYILSEGNPDVILCERGIRTFEPYTRNTLDLSAIPVVKKLTHLPILVDPSHATGIREKVAPMARAAVAAGADGLMVEVHPEPEKAASDGPQSLRPEQFGKLMRDLYVIAPVVGKQLDFAWLDKAAVVRRSPAAEKAGRRAVFFGELGTAAHRATTEYFGGDVEPVPADSYKEVFEATERGDAGYGVIPLQNSLTGSVHENFDLLLDHDLKIVGEIALRIIHTVAAPSGTRMDGIRRVVCDPSSMRQCDEYLRAHPEWELVTVRDAAFAAKQVAERATPGDAAITGAEAARLYGLDILDEGIETNPRNYTRFAILAQEAPAGIPRQKSSMIYQTANRPGALFETLKIFAKHDINLTKLESRPIESQPWEYMFYVDVEVDVEAEAFRPILAELQEHVDFLKLLGSYSAAPSE